MQDSASKEKRLDLASGDPVMFWIGVGIFGYCLIAFAGAAIISSQTRSFYTPIVILHGLLSLAWLLLFSAQARLAKGHDLAKHQWLGSRSPILVGAMVLVGSFVMIMVYVRSGNPVLLFANATIYVQFLAFFAVALAAARKHKVMWHKRLMLFATVSLLGPAHGRFVRLFGLTDEFGGIPTLLALVAIPITYDLFSEGRIKLPTVILIGISLGILALNVAVIISLLSAP